MKQDFNKIMEYAIKRCEGIYVDDGAGKNSFYLIYPFTTENISGYIEEFDLKNKSLLTVGSSGDQAINAILNDCKDISVLDINPYSKFYYYLKIASILSLDIDKYLEFLRYKNYPNVFKYNKNIFNKDSYNKLKPTLRLLDYESYLFWDELFNSFKHIDIRDNLFSNDEDRTSVISACNPYLQSKSLYEITKSKVKRVEPKFIIGDLFKTDLQRKYDNIWLSNIGAYLPKRQVKVMIDKMDNLLNTDGKMLISYLYETTIDTKYKNNWSPIYDLQKTFNILRIYNPSLISFTGVNGLKFQDDNMKDSALIYKKKK